jgi:hypothetical protein
MMRRLAIVLLACVAFATAAARAAQDTPPQAGSLFTGSVAHDQGGATNDLRVVIFPDDAAAWYAVRNPAQFQSADLAGGRFSFAGLPAGNYRVTVLPGDALKDWPSSDLLARIQRRAYPMTIVPGAPAYADFVVNMSGPDPGIVRASRSEAVSMRGSGAMAARGPAPMTPAGPGSISGTITDADGKPVVNAEVRALRPLTTPDGPIQPATSGPPALTDAFGAYRISGLRAGLYLVAVPGHVIDRSTALGVTTFRLPPSAVQPDGSNIGYVTTFFPGVSSTERARAISVNDTDVPRTDFALQRAPVVNLRVAVTGGRISGALTLAPGDVTAQLGGMNVQRAAASPDGTYAFSNVAPGRYYVNGVGPESAGRASFEVSSEARELVITLALARVVSVSGRVDFRGDRAPTPAELGAFRVRLVPDPQLPGSPLYVSALREDGRFSMQNVQKGRYRLLATPPPGWVQAIGMIGGVDTMFVALDITADITDAVVALRINR